VTGFYLSATASRSRFGWSFQPGLVTIPVPAQG
jgi:hypothetical protein